MVSELDPPRRLVTSWRALWDEEITLEEPRRVTWEIEPKEGGYCKLTLVRDRLEGAPKTPQQVSGWWRIILSGLESLVETGSPLSQ